MLLLLLLLLLMLLLLLPLLLLLLVLLLMLLLLLLFYAITPLHFFFRYVKPLAISMGLMFFQQFSGINAVMFYSVNIFRLAGSSIDSNLATIILGVVNIGATIFSNVVIDRLGRKILLYLSSSGE